MTKLNYQENVKVIQLLDNADMMRKCKTRKCFQLPTLKVLSINKHVTKICGRQGIQLKPHS